MKNMKKILVFAMAMLLVMALSVTGTLAWLNSLTGEVTNTFTVGNVTITLDEGDVYELADNVTDEQLGQHKPGVTTTENRVQANAYKLVPGKTYAKDPIVHVDAASEDCYVFVKVINTLTNIEVKDDTTKPTIAQQMANNGWVKLDGVDDVYYYADANGNSRVVGGTHLTVFTNFYIAANADVTTAPPAVTIQAYAVQAENITDPATAWSRCATDWQK